jgi:hypothetical protein
MLSRPWPPGSLPAGLLGRRRPGRFRFDFLALLSLLLLGYAVGGKVFAYLGYSQIYIGEAALAAGSLALLVRVRSWLLLRSGVILPLLLLLIWGGCRLAPDLAEHGVIALRDAVIWGYGWFAVLVYVSLVERPSRLAALSDRYAVFVRYGPVFMALMWALSTALNVITVTPYGTPAAVLKGGELTVHAAGMIAFLYLRVRPLNAGWILGPALLCVLGLNTRAGVLSVFAAVAFLLVIRPSGRKVAAVLGTFLILVVVLALVDFRFVMPVTGREISVDSVGQGIESLFSETGSENLDGTKRWRLLWWQKIYGYTIEGDYFWTGKGFGANLADDDGFSLDSFRTLRSPHNSHLTMLARGGVPGFFLWMLAQGLWFAGMLVAHIRCVRSREDGWARLSLFLLTYWIAFVVNASFDVFLEGPMAGIWFWTVFGTGLAVIRLHPRHRLAHAQRQDLYAAPVWARPCAADSPARLRTGA